MPALSAPHDSLVRRRFTVTGQVQGVGFRPFVFRTAETHGLTGSVRNTPEGVAIEVQGPSAAVEAFGKDLTGKLPPLARIVSLDTADLPPETEETGFRILVSNGGTTGHHVLISPDIATCPDCLADMADPTDRRHLYPFTNCTNCGPRYTITRSIPYDRDKTSMACFPMCPECTREYQDVRDRRFHAQPNACPACGPRVWLTDASGRELLRDDAAVKETAQLLADGRILAIKGLGGFHLACDATAETAVALLRERKRRYGKPLAVMVPDLGTARRLAHLSLAEEELLASIQRPILLVRRRDPSPLACLVAQDTAFVGVMLPYTPLHHVLFHHYTHSGIAGPDRLSALVMTSGNLSSEPIALGNREALARLGQNEKIADFFLLHNRDILIRTDDSVLRVNPDTEQTQFFRRARGYTPSPVFLADSGPSVLGLGPELKATVCLTKGDQAFPSQHIGDLENLETFGFYQETIAHLRDILQTEPELLVRDLHPDYLSSRYAEERKDGLPVITLQHHYAHILSVLAEHRHLGPAVGLAVDGTGYGEDGTIWGGECLFVDTRTLERKRLGHLAPVLLPGGEAAVLEPWRMARSYLHGLGLDAPGRHHWPWLAPERADRADRKDLEPANRFLTQMLVKNINCPVTTSCGRLFDAVAGMLGLCEAVAYEGQAAIILEKVQDMAETGAYPCPLTLTDGPAVLDTLALFRCVYDDFEAGIPAGVISRRFHLGLCRGLAELALHGCRIMGTKDVGLSGGVMQNLTMSLELPRALENLGLAPLSHVLVTPNDGCISLGQAFFGQRSLALGSHVSR